MATVEDFKLRFKVEGENDVKKVKASISDLRKDITSFGDVGGPFGGSINGIVGKLGMLGSGAMIAGGAFVALGMQALAIAGQLADLSGATGVAAGQLLSFKESVIDAGGKAEDFEKLIIKMNQSVQDAAGGNEQLQNAFKTLGVYVTNANGELRPTGDILDDLIAKMKTGDVTGKQYSAAIDILGKTFAKLEPGKLNAIRDPVADEDIKRLDAYNEKIDKVRARLEKGIVTFFGSVAEQADVAFVKVDKLYNYMVNREKELNKIGKTMGTPTETNVSFGLSSLFPREMTKEELAALSQTGKSPAGVLSGMPTTGAEAGRGRQGGPTAEELRGGTGGYGAEPQAVTTARLASEKRTADSVEAIRKEALLRGNSDRLAASLQFASQKEAIELKSASAISIIEINKDQELAAAKLAVYAQEKVSKDQLDKEYAVKRVEIEMKAEAEIAATRVKAQEDLARENKRLNDIIQTSKDIVTEQQRMADLAASRAKMADTMVTATDRERKNVEDIFNLEQERLAQLEKIAKIKDLDPSERIAREKEINSIFADRKTKTVEQQAADKATSENFSMGFKKAYRQYAEDAQNNFELAGQIFKTVSSGMEDQIVNFAKTGKFEFKDFMNTVLEELLRSQVRSLLAQTFSGIGGGSQSAGGGSMILGGLSSLKNMLGFANGGTIPTNSPVLVGERGPEILAGAAGRTVIPNHALGGASVTYNINAVDAPSFKAMIAADPTFLYAVSEQGRRRLPGAR